MSLMNRDDRFRFNPWNAGDEDGAESFKESIRHIIVEFGADEADGS